MFIKCLGRGFDCQPQNILKSSENLAEGQHTSYTTSVKSVYKCSDEWLVEHFIFCFYENSSTIYIKQVIFRSAMFNKMV